ncbi:GNAT family N-acetyltransferase [Streptomyces nymphaeiformis]|uniref:Putative peroxidase-related enzyme n=1 Tax=Streptomyces nymphaeiformis TaxID=2663842 RepID=A0A7W7U486_9ACTN|nr:GNAT family N-acetyltransferase [Streptomyces nymphaeiformis]MBB4984696.1 putative peroxidase-related enzyme [Streptomyces nymphaeiformis]
MTALHTVEPETATGEAAALFTATHQALGVIPNLARVMANSPAVLKGYVGALTALSTAGALPASLRERIALLVAQENRSDYCLSVHAFRGTRTAGLSAAETTRARRGASDDPWAAAVLGLAATMVRDRGAVPNEQLAAARRAGLSDGQIVEVVAHVALNVFTNYLATTARIDIDWPLVRHTEDPHMISIAPLTHVSPEAAAAWHTVVSASLAHDLPEEPRPTLDQIHAQLTVPGRDNRRLLWQATASDGAVVGVAALRLFTSPGQSHLSQLELHVAPDRRRSGVGSRLLATAVAAAQAEQRRSLIAAVGGNGPGDAFCAARGFRRVLALDHLLLDVAQADDAAADAEHPGYELASWTGTVPDALAEAFAAAKNAMNDMPMGDMDYGSQTWTADRVRAMAEVLADRGDVLLTTAVLGKGEMAGYTEIVIRAGETHRALQYDTVVVPAHRGHGLGLWVKAEMLRRLRVEHPGIVEIETDNAQDNTHMLAVNRQLGFRFHRSTHEYQLDLPTT